jgi:hypothetical protein
MTRVSLRRAVLGTAGALLAIALVTVALVACRGASSEGRAAPTGDLAVVTLTGSDRLVTVDLSRMRVVSDVRLRSFVTDLSLDASSGLAVTAQGGGVGDDADDVVGVYDVRRGGPVSYVKLGCPNPAFLTAVDGRAYVEHGMYREGGMVTTVVDLRRRAVERTGLAPPTPVSTFGIQDGLLWTLSLDMDVSEPATDPAGLSLVTLAALQPRTLEARYVGGPLSANQVIGAGPGRLYLLQGSVRGTPGGVAEVDAGTAEPIRRVALPSLSHGAQRGVLAGRWLAVTEWDGLDLADEGTRIAWIDREGMRVGGTIDVAGGPCAIAAWGERILVVERRTSRLLAIDPATGRVTGSVDLGGSAPIVADVEVLPAG